MLETYHVLFQFPYWGSSSLLPFIISDEEFENRQPRELSNELIVSQQDALGPSDFFIPRKSCCFSGKSWFSLMEYSHSIYPHRHHLALWSFSKCHCAQCFLCADNTVNRCYWHHFRDEETDAQRDEIKTPAPLTSVLQHLLCVSCCARSRNKVLSQNHAPALRELSA